MQIPLMDVQKEALKRSKGRTHFAWFMEMGLGKTLTALKEFYDLYQEGKVDVMIVFCPQTLIPVWRAEVKKWGFDFRVNIKPQGSQMIKPGDIVLYNYESIIANAGAAIGIISSTHRVYACFDESVQVKNFKAKRWLKIKGWKDSLSYTRLLSGRPIVQNIMDIWTQMRLLQGRVHNSPYAFRNKFARMGGWMGKVIIGSQNDEELKEIINEVSWTATKRDWTDLPEKLYPEPRQYAMTAEQKIIYSEMFINMVVEIQNNESISVAQAVHKYQKLQQITSGFMYDEDSKVVPLMEFDKVPKVKLLDEILEETTGKCVIFGHYRPSIDSLIKKYGCPFIKSGMTDDEIDENKRIFNEEDNRLPIVCQSSSAKYGHTLLGTENTPCNTTVYFENSYSLDARIQSEDRNHRYGQKLAVLYLDLVGSSIEARMINTLVAKDSMSRALQEIQSYRDAA